LLLFFLPPLPSSFPLSLLFLFLSVLHFYRYLYDCCLLIRFFIFYIVFFFFPAEDGLPSCGGFRGLGKCVKEKNKKKRD
ncbi:hypothetical protein, partial [Escherichia coli]|uniref:hypothetical protein n=1 Tax=Escherichia coli TaxID=562 RepID=UPI001BC88E46